MKHTYTISYTWSPIIRSTVSKITRLLIHVIDDYSPPKKVLVWKMCMQNFFMVLYQSSEFSSTRKSSVSQTISQGYVVPMDTNSYWKPWVIIGTQSDWQTESLWNTVSDISCVCFGRKDWEFISVCCAWSLTFVALHLRKDICISVFKFIKCM